MRESSLQCTRALRTTALVLLISFGAALQGAPPAGKPAAPATGSASLVAPSVTGLVRVNGKELRLAHGALLRAPDAFEASQQNAIVFLTPQPLDPGKLQSAGTLLAALDLSPQRVVFEVKPDKSARLSICHDGFGEGKCYSTSVAPFDWKPGVVDEKRVSGSTKSFAGKEETVFETIKLYYELQFDVTGGRALPSRR